MIGQVLDCEVGPVLGNDGGDHEEVVRTGDYSQKTGDDIVIVGGICKMLGSSVAGVKEDTHVDSARYGLNPLRSRRPSMDNETPKHKGLHSYAGW